MAAETFRVPGIHCDGCLFTISYSLTALPGVESVSGDARRKSIQVHYRPETVSPEQIASALTKIGFPVERDRPVRGRSQ